MAFFGENSCDAWVNFDGAGTVSIRDSFNVSSITDHGTGDYAVNWSSIFATDDYCAISSAGGTSGIPTVKIAHSGNDFGVAEVRIQTLNTVGNGGVMDNDTVCLAVWADT